MTDQRAKKGPWLTELVEGDPIRVEGRELVPMVRVTSRMQRRASLCDERVSGRGHGFIYMRPVAILDEGANGQGPQEHHPIRNGTARLVGWMALAAFLIPWLATLLVYLSRKSDNRDRQRPSA